MRTAFAVVVLLALATSPVRAGGHSTFDVGLRLDDVIVRGGAPPPGDAVSAGLSFSVRYRRVALGIGVAFEKHDGAFAPPSDPAMRATGKLALVWPVELRVYVVRVGHVEGFAQVGYEVVMPEDLMHNGHAYDVGGGVDYWFGDMYTVGVRARYRRLGWEQDFGAATEADAFSVGVSIALHIDLWGRGRQAPIAVSI